MSVYEAAKEAGVAFLCLAIPLHQFDARCSPACSTYQQPALSAFVGGLPFLSQTELFPCNPNSWKYLGIYIATGAFLH